MTPITTQTLENALTAKLMVSFGKTAPWSPMAMTW